MSNSNLFDVENIKLNNLDVNKLFHIDLSYNFEGLTSAIEALIFAQKFNNQRLSLLEKYNIERNERLEKQEVKNEILNETSLYIHNFVGEKEDFKKSFEEMKENLKEQERIKLEKIEKEAKKQREELEQSIINIYKNYNPIKDESNKDQELLKKGFTIIEKEIFNINDKDQKFNKNENLEKTKIKEKEINLNKENSEENEHKNISNKGTTDCSKRFRKLEKELLNIREKLKKYKNKEIIEEIKNLMDQDREKKKKNKLKIKPKNLDSDANDIAMIKNDNIDMDSSTINQKDNIENNLDMEKKRNSIDDNNKNSGDEEDVNLKDKKKIINGNLSMRKMSQNDFSDILLIKNEIKIINNLLGQNSLSLSIKNLKERLDKFEKSSDDFNSNTDLQIIDQFLGKSKDGDNHGDFIRPILESFEKRIANKMQHNEEKFRRNDDEIYKIKNDMFNVKMTIETHNKLLNELKNDFTSHDDKLKDNAKSLKELDSHIKEYISAQVLLLQNYINVKLGDFNLEPNLNITPRIEEGNDSERSKNITATDDKIRKKIGELEKNFRILLVKFNSLDKLFKDVALLTDDMNKKVGKTEFNEIKEQMYNNTNQLIFIKDNVIQLMEDRNILEEVTKLRKKFEIINATVMGLKPHTEDSSPSHRGHIESLRYVEITTFNDFQKQLKKELEFLLNRINDIRNTIDDDLIVNIQKRASIDELKSLEDFLILKLEELKQGSTKKFADKNEVGKNIRYLDSQVKHIMDVYIKKMEKGDNWLLAKKPINGHVCASCENYLGDLHDNNQFVPWNKVTHQDRIYRIGSGFSRMLQNLNVDGNEKQNEDNDKFHSRNKSNQPLVPRISSFRSSNKPLENSMDVTTFDNKIEHSIPEVSYDDPNKPKVVKIYKVKKDKKDDK